MIRGRMINKVGDPIEFLADVRAGRYVKRYTGFDLQQAIALANKGLLLVQVLTQVAGPWNNVCGGTTEYRITLTDEGSELLDKAAATGHPAPVNALSCADGESGKDS